MNAIGIDLGATNVKFVHVDESGAIVARDSFPTDDRDDAPWAHRIREYLTNVPRETPIGLCAPGLAARDGRSIAWMQGRLARIQGLDWTTYLHWPKPIPVLNDAHAALLGEAWIGAARGAQNAFMLTLGTGVGGAILADGKLLRGHLGRAGHLGHITLDPAGKLDLVNTPGSLEDAIGNCTITQRTAGRFKTTHDLVAAHLAGDCDATAVWLRSIRDLAAAISSLINVLDPELIVIGGGIAVAGPALFDPLQRELSKIEWRPTSESVQLVPAQLGELAGAIGAARAAMLPI
jgi:glucokinase